MRLKIEAVDAAKLSCACCGRVWRCGGVDERMGYGAECSKREMHVMRNVTIIMMDKEK